MIDTDSAWTYGHTITDDNKFLEFEETVAGILTAELNVGSYSLTDYALEISRAMNAASLNESYSTSLNRATRKITITGSSTFSLLINSATTAPQSTYPLAGFNGADLTGSASYEGDSPSGSIFEPQFLLQNFIDFEDDQQANNVSVSETPSGIVEVIKYGDVNFMTCNVKYQKNNNPEERSHMGSSIRFDANGKDNLDNFIKYAVTKAPLEFIPDKLNPDSFTKCLLEKTPRSSTGTGFLNRELYAENFATWFETGNIVFRKIII